MTAFISYAHKDERLREELDTHLKLLVRTGDLDAWHDRSIVPGEKWEGRINENLQRADMVLLLLSPDFIASDYCDKEMEIAMQREAAGRGPRRARSSRGPAAGGIFRCGPIRHCPRTAGRSPTLATIRAIKMRPGWRLRRASGASCGTLRRRPRLI